MLELKIDNLENFQKAIKAHAEMINSTPRKVAKKMILAIHRQTVLLTPVDTGRLVGGWQISTNDSSPSFHTNKWEEAPNQPQNTNAIMREQIDSEQNRTDYDFKSRFFWVANNVEYARWQEYGNGRTIGKFMLEQAVQEVTARAYELAKQAVKE